jgi:hypothetical protein
MSSARSKQLSASTNCGLVAFVETADACFISADAVSLIARTSDGSNALRSRVMRGDIPPGRPA